MGKFLTSASRIIQLPQKGQYKLVDNELYKDDDNKIYIAWRGFQTDNFTWIKSSDWDIRCSHQHDVGCLYHSIVEVILTEEELIQKGYLRRFGDIMVCEDIPKEYLKIKNITGHEVNNLFYRTLKSADCPKTPKYIQYLYRAGVSFNLNWFRTGKVKIYLENLYK